MENLIQAKDEEIAKLQQVKAALTGKFREQKQTIAEMQAELDAQKEAFEAAQKELEELRAKGGGHPDEPEAMTADLQKRNQDLQAEAIEMLRAPGKPKLKSMKDMPSSALGFRIPREFVDSFQTLSQHSKRLDQKMDAIWQRLGQIENQVEAIAKRPATPAGTGTSGGTGGAAGEGAGAQASRDREPPEEDLTGPPAGLKPRRPSDLIRKQPAGQEKPVASAATTSEGTKEEAEPSPAFRPRRPSDILKARQAEEQAQEETEKEEVKEEEEFRPRRPSDVLKAQQATDATKEGDQGETGASAGGSGGPAKPASSGEGAAKADGEQNFRPRRPSDVMKAQQAGAGGGPGGESGGETPEKPAGPKARATAAGIHSEIHYHPYPDDGVVKCPKCGKQEYKEMENREVVVAYAPVRKYGRKFLCKNCREEWAYK